jgi:hypothetical protein
MTGLSDNQALALIRVGVLAAGHAAALSAFELALVTEVTDRYLARGRSAWITPNEWTVIEAAIDAMEALRAQRRAA